MTRKVSIALGQMSSTLADVPANIKKALEFIEKAAEKGGDIVCLPELFATGYNLSLLQEQSIILSQKWYFNLIGECSIAAKENNIYVLAPFGIQKKDGIYNGASLFTPMGELLGQYCKTHAFEQERLYFNSGSKYPVFDTDLGKIGIMICYDAGFPEVARSLCNQGAEIIFVPSAWRMQDEIPWLLNIPSRALENQLFTVGVNRTGHEGDLHLLGKSMVCDPWGRIVYQMDSDTDGIAVVTIDVDAVHNCRSQGGYLQDIKPSSYLL